VRQDEVMPSSEVEFSILAKSGVPVRSFKRGETIFREGDVAEELYVIQSGQVEIVTGNRQLATLGENGIFGEMALIDKDPRSATARALTDVTLVPVAEKQFLFLVSQTPFFALKVMRVLAGRLRIQNNAI
jgi:CRP/FNR family cyclic AMP-dependent transcriptional regulator